MWNAMHVVVACLTERLAEMGDAYNKVSVTPNVLVHKLEFITPGLNVSMCMLSGAKLF